MYWDKLFCYDSLYSAVIYKGSRCSLRTYFSQCSYSPMCSVAHLLGGCLCAFNFYTFSLGWNPRVKTAVCYTKTLDLPLISLCRCHKHNRISWPDNCRTNERWEQVCRWGKEGISEGIWWTAWGSQVLGVGGKYLDEVDRGYRKRQRALYLCSSPTPTLTWACGRFQLGETN